RQSLAGLPNSSLAAVRCVIVNRRPLERRGIEPKNPAMIGISVGMRTKGYVDHTIYQQQARPLQLLHGVKSDDPIDTVITGSRYASANHNGPAKFLLAGEDVQCMQALEIGAVLFGKGDNVKSTGGGVD